MRQPTITSLQEAGFEVTIEHRRVFDGNFKQLETVYQHKQRQRMAHFASSPQSHGGETVATISKDGKTATGIAQCSKRDVFNRCTGRTID